MLSLRYDNDNDLFVIECNEAYTLYTMSSKDVGKYDNLHNLQAS